MDVMQKLTFCTLQKNKKRTIVTIIGIILSTALITAVACMGESLRASMVAYEKAASGDYHYCFYGVEQENLKYFENNRNIEKIRYETELGYALLDDSENKEKPYLFIKGMTAEAMEVSALSLIKGRLPENEHEIVISRHTIANGGADISIGDTLHLALGYREADGDYQMNQSTPFMEEETFVPEEERDYEVVGIIERPQYAVEQYTAPGYTAVTYQEHVEDAEKVNLYVSYTKSALKNRAEVTAGLLGVSEELLNDYEQGCDLTVQEQMQIEQVADYYEDNYWVIKWELLDFSNSTMNLLYSMCGIAIAIIIVASVFCIRNSFAISLTEKMKLYGMISSIGATKKQRKKMVYTEAAFLGIIGVPLGILSGIFATWVLVKCTSRLMVQSLDVELVYVMSVPAMIIGGILSIVTIFLSAGHSARKAAKLSPIQAIRGNEMVKLSAKKIKQPGVIKGFFGIGGTIAYKNLKRSKVKYRTTVISIVVSVAIFIGMTTFVQMAFMATTYYYQDIDYQLQVALYEEDAKENYEKAVGFSQIEEVSYIETERMIAYFKVPLEELKYNEAFVEMRGGIEYTGGEGGIGIVSLGEQAYAQFCSEVGISAEGNEQKAVLIAGYDEEYIDENGETKHETGYMYDYQAGDKITGMIATGALQDEEDYKEEEVTLEISVVTDVKPASLYYSYSGILVVSDAWIEAHGEYLSPYIYVYMKCDDSYAVEDKIIEKLDASGYSNYNIVNEEEEYQKIQSLYLLIAIFLYGFIVVIALIGITNIFNTITTNMELRAKEFAMLKSVGMTSSEFRRMIQLENLFYGGKSLLFGIPVGCLFSYLFYYVMGEKFGVSFELPLMGIAISVAAVMLLLFGITRYSLRKVNRKNIIETIQNDNI